MYTQHVNGVTKQIPSFKKVDTDLDDKYDSVILEGENDISGFTNSSQQQ